MLNCPIVEPLAALMVDLDGTLLDRPWISPRVAGAVRRAARRVPVSIASGREIFDVLEFARELGLTAPQIGDGGATCVNPLTGDRIWTNSLQAGHARALVAALGKAGVPFFAIHPEGTVASIPEITHWDLTRVATMDIDETAADVLVDQFQEWASVDAVKVFLHYNGLWAVDFNPAGVDKGTAVVRLAGLLGIRPSQIVAVGDSFNDVPMLAACGVGVAMGNAPPEIQAMADFVAPPVDQDGLAWVIDNVLLPRLK